MELFVVTAYDLTAHRLIRVFSTKEKAEKFKEDLKELLWKQITIDKVVLDKQLKNPTLHERYELKDTTANHFKLKMKGGFENEARIME